jgi:hypothetical protein
MSQAPLILAIYALISHNFLASRDLRRSLRFQGAAAEAGLFDGLAAAELEEDPEDA